MHSPPALAMRARAVSVKRSAQIFIAGISSMRTSSVTVPTTHATLSSFSFMNFASLESESGGRFVLLMNKRLSTTLTKSVSVRRARKRYSFTRSRTYRFSLTGAWRPRFCVALRPPALMSIPIFYLRAGSHTGVQLRRRAERTGREGTVAV